MRRMEDVDFDIGRKQFDVISQTSLLTLLRQIGTLFGQIALGHLCRDFPT